MDRLEKRCKVISEATRKEPSELETPQAAIDSGFALSEPSSNGKRVRKGGKPLDVSNDSVTGVVRNILRGAGGPITINQILEMVPSGLSLTVDRDAIYRVLPKMQARQEIVPTGKRGEYRYNAEKYG